MTKFKIFTTSLFSIFILGLFTLIAPQSHAQSVVRDEWIFFGDSITGMTMGSGAGSFSERVNALNPNVYPIQYNEGVSNLTTGRAIKSLQTAIRRHPSAKYVAISLGTNDSNWNGVNCKNNPDGFYQDYANLVQYVLNANKIPVVPTLPSAYIEKCGWSNVAQIQKLYVNFPQIIPGPDLWNHFWIGPDGTHSSRTPQQIEWFPEIHPSTTGKDEYRRVWAEEMVKRVYPTPSPTPTPTQ